VRGGIWQKHFRHRHENGTMKPAEIVFRKGAMGVIEKRNLIDSSMHVEMSHMFSRC
jgi:hypothetical protein